MSGIWSAWEAAVDGAMAALGEAALGAGVVIEKAGVHAEVDLERLDQTGREAAERFQQAAAVAAAEMLTGMTQAALDLAQQATELEMKPMLHGALSALRNDDLPALLHALEEGTEALGVGHEVVRAMSAFAPPLEWAQGVVGMIGDLLDAMNLGL